MYKSPIELQKPKAYSQTQLLLAEAAFRAEVAQILANEAVKRQRLADIIADPSLARIDELSPYLIDKVMTARLGHGATGTILIAGLTCHRTLQPADPAGDRAVGLDRQPLGEGIAREQA